MGISTSFAKFLIYCKSNGVKFTTTLTLGRQKLYINKSKLEREITSFNDNNELSKILQSDGYSESFFKMLGTRKLNCIDYSDYEGANIIYDLNKPFCDNLLNSYSVVLDSGTLEHVFNFPIAIKNCMSAVEIDGHFIAITPANNMMGHGFYQFSPELYFRIFSKENGFIMELALIGICDEEGEIVKWYKVKDPQVVKQRVTLTNQCQTFLFILAKKISDVNIFALNPYQSDYVANWENSVAEKTGQKKGIKKKLKKALPQFLLRLISGIISKRKNKITYDDFIGQYNSNHFTEFSFPIGF